MPQSGSTHGSLKSNATSNHSNRMGALSAWEGRNKMPTQGTRGGFKVGSLDMPFNKLRIARVSLTSAQILALNSTPVTLIPAPGAGLVISVEEIVFTMARTATAYAAGGAL